MKASGKTDSVYSASIITLIISLLLMSAILASVWLVLSPASPLALEGRAKAEFWVHLGVFAAILAIFSVTPFLVKRVPARGKRSVLVFLKKNHCYAGWAGILLAAGHGAFFLASPPAHPDTIYTGAAALALMLISAGAGQCLKGSKTGTRLSRRLHIFTGLTFTALFISHII